MASCAACRVGGLVALLALLVAVPVALAAVDKQHDVHELRANGNPGDNRLEEHQPDGVHPGRAQRDTTATAYFSSDGGDDLHVEDLREHWVPPPSTSS